MRSAHFVPGYPQRSVFLQRENLFDCWSPLEGFEYDPPLRVLLKSGPKGDARSNQVEECAAEKLGAV